MTTAPMLFCQTN